MIKSSNFCASLSQDIQRITTRTGLPNSKAFLFWFATEILELTEVDATEAISVEGANDKGIDLFFVDDEESRVLLIQGKYSSDCRYQAKETDASKLESSLNWLSNPEALRREGKIELAEAAEDYIEALKKSYGVELWYVYTGPRSANVEKHITVYNQNPDNFTKRRTFRHYAAELLDSTWREIHGTPQRIPKARIKTTCNFEFAGDFGKALVAVVPGGELARLHKKHGERLFARNVRIFLGARPGSVNAAIAETLADDKERGNFWAYNNGITVICGSVVIGKNCVNVKDFSIVNGCQTTVSIGLAPNALNNVSVLVRFIAASSRIVDDVIRCTNSQNSIRTWDIASQDKTQRRLKKEFGKLNKPYIYLTRRGDKPSGELTRFREDGKLRQIRIDVAGQYSAAFRGDPVLAYKHKAFIFSERHDDFFPPDVRVEEVLLQWVCGEVCKDVVADAIAKGNSEDTEIRILNKGGILFVLATLARIALARNGPTYLKSITEERVSSKLAKQRLRKYAEYSKTSYVQAVADLAEMKKEELSTLIRQREFWDKVIERVCRSFQKESIAKKWLDEALPRLF